MKLERKRHYCNNGVINKYWYDDTGIPEGFVNGHLPLADEAKARRLAKIKATNLKKYGVENTFNLPRVLEKSHSPEVICIQKERREITKEKKYGDKNWSNTEQAQRTMTERYGGILKGSSITAKKIEETLEKKYGNKYYSNREQAVITRAKNGKGYVFRKYYMYKDIHFDSSWELYYFIYNEDNGNNISRCTTHYKYLFENKTHTYTPDFIINGVEVDVKGSHFIQKDKMINPYNRSQDDLSEAKHQCMIKNNVKLILEDEINKCKDYVDSKYGQNYIDQFEITSK